jgi:hypothetical protein
LTLFEALRATSGLALFCLLIGGAICLSHLVWQLFKADYYKFPFGLTIYERAQRLSEALPKAGETLNRNWSGRVAERLLQVGTVMVVVAGILGLILLFK